MFSRRSFAALVAAVAGGAALAVSPVTPAQAIVGGKLATSAPWAVRVYEDGQPICTGAVVAPRWIITAGHCVRFDNSDISFRVGRLDQRRGQVVKRIPGHTVFAPNADVALVEIPPVKVTPIPLPAKTATPAKRGTLLTVQGWGATCEPNESSCQSNLLRQATVRVIAHTDKRCDLLAGTADYCAEKRSGLPVGGDSGAPALTYTKKGRAVLAGVFTASDREAVVAVADITKARAWVAKTIGAK
ncbi:trypsin-like serine protease [Actinoplanes sp. NPDC048796]|uniref:S1 family peptidase n=1 Tax=Actinoplanes sp. NPDC048796 TaxID=3155640 RepID=UPI0034078F70